MSIRESWIFFVVRFIILVVVVIDIGVILLWGILGVGLFYVFEFEDFGDFWV